MDQQATDEDDEFWGRPSARQALEVGRQIRRERDAKAWRRNLISLTIVLLLTLGALLFRR